MAVDNDSDEHTAAWLPNACDHVLRYSPQIGVSAGWNRGLARLFGMGAKHVLVINNDVILPTTFYEKLLAYDFPFVTGVAVEDQFTAGLSVAWFEPVPHPDFSAYLIRRECWETVGRFDETMVHYASDCDLHVRAHRLGVPMMKVPVPFYHERSSTLRHSTPEERRRIELQAEADRQTFRNKYGCVPGDEQYARLFDAVIPTVSEVNCKSSRVSGPEGPQPSTIQP